MNNMQKQTLIVIASLALLSGCGGKGSGTAASGSTPAAAEISGAAKVQQIQAGAGDAAVSSVKGTVAPAQASSARSQADEGELQAVAAAPDLVTGEKVYKGTCSICHRSGLKGAPRLGIKEDWGSRLTQDKETLYNHAINGFRGKKGNMPSRGSNSKLSETEVKAAVDYMVVHAVPSWSVGN